MAETVGPYPQVPDAEALPQPDCDTTFCLPESRAMVLELYCTSSGRLRRRVENRPTVPDLLDRKVLLSTVFLDPASCLQVAGVVLIVKYAEKS